MNSSSSNPSRHLYACQLTGAGRGAVAVIALQGDLLNLDQFFRAINNKKASEQTINQICYGEWGTSSPEDIVFLRTADNQAEIHCHGGQAAVSRILADLQSLHYQILNQQQWLEKNHSPVVAECLQAVTQATTKKTALHLLRQSQLLPAAITELSTLNEETDPDWEHRQTIIHELLKWKDFGIHLTTPWTVILCGRPNVGKSSLINALVGYSRSIVYDQPGTTRDVLSVESALDGWPVEFLDTAGLRMTDSELEQEGISRAKARINTADLVLHLLDASEGLIPEDESLRAAYPHALSVWNKIDLNPAVTHHTVLQVSAKNGQGIDSLLKEMITRLIPEEPACDRAYPVTTDQVTRLQELQQSAQQQDAIRFQQLISEWLS